MARQQIFRVLLTVVCRLYDHHHHHCDVIIIIIIIIIIIVVIICVYLDEILSYFGDCCIAKPVRLQADT